MTPSGGNCLFFTYTETLIDANSRISKKSFCQERVCRSIGLWSNVGPVLDSCWNHSGMQQTHMFENVHITKCITFRGG